MTYERFLKITLGLQKEERNIRSIYQSGVSLIDFVDQYHSIISELIKEVYGEEGYDWWSWFCYENEFGQRDWSTEESYRIKDDGTSEKVHEKGELRFGAYDKEGNPICYDHRSTWEYLENNYANWKENKK